MRAGESGGEALGELKAQRDGASCGSPSACAHTRLVERPWNAVYFTFPRTRNEIPEDSGPPFASFCLKRSTITGAPRALVNIQTVQKDKGADEMFFTHLSLAFWKSV